MQFKVLSLCTLDLNIKWPQFVPLLLTDRRMDGCRMLGYVMSFADKSAKLKKHLAAHQMIIVLNVKNEGAIQGMSNSK